MANTRFPGPYINTTNEMDPLMIRVPMDKTDIGANSAGQPKGSVNSDNMMLRHVGGQLGTPQGR